MCWSFFSVSFVFSFALGPGRFGIRRAPEMMNIVEIIFVAGGTSLTNMPIARFVYELTVFEDPVRKVCTHPFPRYPTSLFIAYVMFMRAMFREASKCF